MIKIAFIAPSQTMLETARIVAGKYSDLLFIEQALHRQGAAMARKLRDRGTLVFISRGGTAAAIKAFVPDCSVVPIGVTGSDLLRAGTKALRHGRRIGVVAFPYMLRETECLRGLLDAEFTLHPITGEDAPLSVVDEEVMTRVLEARAAGAEVILGGLRANIAAGKAGMDSVIVESGYEAIGNAVAEAVRLIEAIERERKKYSVHAALVSASPNAVFAVGADGAIRTANGPAAALLRRGKGACVGAALAEAAPELGRFLAASAGKKRAARVVSFGNREMLCEAAALDMPSPAGEEESGFALFCRDPRAFAGRAAVAQTRPQAGGHEAKAFFADIRGESPALLHAINLAQKYAKTESTVLICGETGTGKELFAQSIHNAGSRAQGPFVAINCAAIPAHLMESELFGYGGGAFTGANPKGRKGLLETAHTGTVFLDEITELDLSVQGKLLRFLQEKRFMRLGEGQPVPVDVRVIAATNKNLQAITAEGTFRDDLYYRINVLTLTLPPLRERPGDIPVLARTFLESFARPEAKPPALSTDALRLLSRHTWPGNIRELQNTIERLVVTASSQTISKAAAAAALPPRPEKGGVRRYKPGEGDIREALAATRGHLGKAAERLGMSRSSLWRKRRAIGL